VSRKETLIKKREKEKESRKQKRTKKQIQLQETKPSITNKKAHQKIHFTSVLS
jgi:hypothetical protein